MTGSVTQAIGCLRASNTIEHAYEQIPIRIERHLEKNLNRIPKAICHGLGMNQLGFEMVFILP